MWQGRKAMREGTGEYLCRHRRRNLIIFLAAWSCFLVRKEPLVGETDGEGLGI